MVCMAVDRIHHLTHKMKQKELRQREHPTKKFMQIFVNITVANKTMVK